ncbi:MAG: cache domain-containing protein, partial [Prochloraceae cyanobacterium]
MSVRTILILSFTIQISTAVGLTGWLSFRNGQRAVNDLASQLSNEITSRIELHIQNYLKTPYLFGRVNKIDLRSGDLGLENLSALESYFWNQIQLLDSVAAVYFANKQGHFVEVQRRREQLVLWQRNSATFPETKIYQLDRWGKPEKLIDSYQYEPRIRPWYKSAINAQKPIWSEIYQFFYPSVLGITAAMPVYTKKGELQGVLAMDLTLSQIGDFMSNLKVSRSGQAFIMERSGAIVASSASEPSFITVGKEPKRLMAIDSSEPLIQATAKYLQAELGNNYQINHKQQFNFALQGQQQLVQLVPLKDKWGLDWLIVVVIPEADFMERINANTRNTILLCMAALVVSAIVGILIAQWITKPILGLSTAAKALCAGEWEQTVEVKGAKELEQLANSFNKMVTQLQESFGNLEVQNAQMKCLNDSLKRLDRLRDEFLANTSHELKTPLNGIIGIAESLLDGVSGKLSAPVCSNLVAISASGKRLANLVNDIL